MIELKTYNYSELIKILNCNNRQSLERKMASYCIEYERQGTRAPHLSYTITAIEDYYKVYCILELGFDSRTDFDKLKQYLYHFLCDDSFVAMPLEGKVVMMKKYNTHISRQTISNYEQHLRTIEYFHTSDSNFEYYFVKGKEVIKTDETTYKTAWKELWDSLSKGKRWKTAYEKMKKKYGGYAKKIAVQEANAFYAEKINYLINLTVESIEDSLKK